MNAGSRLKIYTSYLSKVEQFFVVVFFKGKEEEKNMVVVLFMFLLFGTGR